MFSAMETQEIIQALDRAIPMIERYVEARLGFVEDKLKATVRVVDDLDRAVEAIEDDRLREALRRHVAWLDAALEAVTRELGSVVTHGAWDPVRDISTDLKVELRHPPRSDLTLNV